MFDGTLPVLDPGAAFGMCVVMAGRGSITGAGGRGFAVAAALLLTGCTSSLETPEAMMPTGKYNFYNCEQLAIQAREFGNREQQLREAMTKASSGGPGGEFINAVAYRSEYLSVQGDLKEMEIAAQSKNCKQRLRAISDTVVR